MMRSGQSRCQRVRKLCSRYQRSTAANGPSVTVARERLRAAARRAAGGCAAKPSAKGATSIGLFVRQSKLLTWGEIERVCRAFPPPRAPHCALPTTTITLQYATYRTLFCISYQRSVIKNVSVLNPPMYFPSSLVSMFLDGRMYVSQCCNGTDKQLRPRPTKFISRWIRRPEEQVYATISGDSTCLSALFETRW